MPVAITIITFSSPTSRPPDSQVSSSPTSSSFATSLGSHPQDAKGTNLTFPAPPLTVGPRGIELQLVRHLWLRVKKRHERGEDSIGVLGGFGSASNNGERHVPNINVDKVWVPASSHAVTEFKGCGDETSTMDLMTELKTEKHPRGEDVGVWRQEARYTSTLTLTCSPAFECEIMGVSVRVCARSVIACADLLLHLLTLSGTVCASPPPTSSVCHRFEGIFSGHGEQSHWRGTHPRRVKCRTVPKVTTYLDLQAHGPTLGHLRLEEATDA